MLDRSYAVCCIIFLFFITSVIAGSVFATERPTLDFIAAALRNQQDACSPSLRISYTVSTVTDDGELHSLWNIHYIRTPEVLFLQDRLMKDGGASTISLYAYNRVTKEGRVIGKRLKDNGVVSASTSSGAISSRFTVHDIIETSASYAMLVPLYEAIMKGTLAAEPEIVDGHKCWRIDIPSGNVGYTADGQFTVWLDPDIGYCPRRMERIRNGSVNVTGAFRISYTGYQDLGNGVWFPTEQIKTGGGPKTVDTVSRLSDVRIGVPVSAEEITVDFPPGTRVWNQNSKEYFTTR